MTAGKCAGMEPTLQLPQLQQTGVQNSVSMSWSALHSKLGLVDGAEHAVQQLVVVTAHKGGAGTYLEKSIALHIIPFMHQPASVARNSFPQVLHGAARQSMQTFNFHFLAVY